MVIGIDASRANRSEKTGVEWYGWHIIEELKKIIPEEGHRVILYSEEPLKGQLAMLPKNWESLVLAWQPKRLWTQVRLSLEMILHPPDALFVPSHAAPIFHPKRTIAVVHDVSALRFKEAYSWFESWYSIWSARYAVRYLWKVIVPSQWTKDELLKLEYVRGSKIIVVPHGCDPTYGIKYDEADIDEELKKYDIHKPFIVSVGRLELKKNIPNLIRAFDYLRGKHNLELVLVGKPGFGYEKIKLAISQSPYKYNIRLLGWKDAETIAKFFRAAEAFVFPSMYEGFGMPLLEAFSAGAPVIASGTGALTEVGGDGAIFVNGSDIYDVSRGIEQVLNNSSVRQSFIEKGYERVKQFSWNKVGREVADAIINR